MPKQPTTFRELLKKMKEDGDLPEDYELPTDEPEETSEIPSIDQYTEPEITPQVRKKIKRLQRITKPIEKKLVTSAKGIRIKKGLKIDYRKELNPQQLAAATIINGSLLVIAGAGTGKTRTVVYRVAYLIENGIPPEKILLLTFTRKAAKEMISRASALLKGMRCEKITGGTFHSFANMILRRYSGLLGIRPNFTIVDTGDSADIIDLVRRELKFDKREKAFPRKDRLQEIISKARNCNTTIKKVIGKEFSGLEDFLDDIKLIAKAFAKYKKLNHLLDYDDLMEVLRDSLKNNPAFRTKVQDAFPYVMVDEFQDTNVIQKEITDLIAEKHRNVMVVGDDSQSIYSFRGANFENILRFPETYPDCKYVKIEHNYRSTPEILDFTNSIIDNAKLGYKKKLFSTKPHGSKPMVKHLYSQDDEAECVVTRVLEQRDRGIPLNQMAVLYRASFHGDYIQAELLKRDIPYVVYGGIKFVERRHVKDMIAYLRIILNPFDAVSWNRVLQLLEGVGTITASKIVEHIRKHNGVIDFKHFSERKYSASLKHLAEVLNEASQDKVSIPAKIEMLLKYYKPILESREVDANTRLEDINVLRELSRKYNDLEKFLSDFALDPPSNKFQDRNTPRVDEREEKESLVLSTVHSAKGLEWHTVFVVHLIDGLFPSVQCIEDIEQLEEERRLFYVACTRAKQQLHLTIPSYAHSWGAHFTLTSRFLVEVDEDFYDVL